MSVPNKYTTWGGLSYEGKNYGVLYGFHIHQEIWKKLEQYKGEVGCLKSTAPWATIKVTWSIEENKLYLTKLCSIGLLEEITGNAKLLADWVDEMELLVKRRKVCRTYEQRGSYINEIDIMRLKFDQGSLMGSFKKKELCRSIEMKSYIDRYPAYATLRMESEDLLHSLEDKENRSKEDRLQPLLLDHLNEMLKNAGESDICLGIEDLKSVLVQGELAIFASAKGKDIDEMIGALLESVTDGFISIKGCLLHLVMNENYPTSPVEKFANGIEKKMNYDGAFYIGTLSNNELAEDEIVIRLLASV